MKVLFKVSNGSQSHLADVTNDMPCEEIKNIKGIKIKEFKKTTRYYEDKVITINKNLDNAMNDFEEKMKSTKNTLINKEYVKSF